MAELRNDTASSPLSGGVGPPRAGGDPAYVEPIVKYYDGTWFDYRVVWMRGLGMHWGYWDDQTRNHAESLTNMTRELAGRATLRPGMKVLDAGCGVGGPALWLAETYGVEVLGVTLSEVQLARARRYAARRKLEHLVRFEIADFTALPYDEGSFDVVWAQESVCHVPGDAKQLFLKEANRVLRPGGTMLMEDWFRIARPYTADNETLMHEWLQGWAINDLATTDEITNWSRDAGFGEVDLRNITPFAFRSIRRLHRLAVWLGPGGLILKALGLRTDVEQANLHSAKLQWAAYQRNLWLIGLLSATKPR